MAETPQLVKVGRNGGRLYSGGVPGNKGGGVRPWAVRQAALKGTADAVPVYVQMVQGGKEFTPMEKLAAGHLLKDISGITRPAPEVLVEEEVVGAFIDAVADHLQSFRERLAEECPSLRQEFDELLRALPYAITEGVEAMCDGMGLEV